MGNHIIQYKRLPEASTAMASYSPLPTKMDVKDPHSTAIEMETVQQTKGNREWFKSYPRLNTLVKSVSPKKLKPVLCVIAVCVIVILFALVIKYASAPSSSLPTGLFTTNERVLQLEEQITLLQENISQFSDHQSSEAKDVASFSARLSEVENKLNKFAQKTSSKTQDDATLSRRLGEVESKVENAIQKPLNLYKNCEEDTSSCSISPDHSHTNYWRDCPTRYLPIHKQVCYWVEITPSSIQGLLIAHIRVGSL